MSGTLKWRPVTNDWQFGAKGAVRDVIYNNGTRTLDRSHFGWLEGMRDVGHKDAQNLIDAIQEHGEIEIVTEF